MIALRWNNLSPDRLHFVSARAIGGARPALMIYGAGLLLGSSAVEQSAVNRSVGGSNPSRGASFS
jgi:hypothetical protein